jgi:threo-3-hydroxy-L-aspartate ammonia-lyase
MPTPPMSADAPPRLVAPDEIRAAEARIRGIARRTPLVPGPTTVPGAALRLKCENLQVAGAFKIRGAANMLAQLPRDDLARGVITYSSGNHGQALACAARLLGVPAVVVMPTTAPPVKINGTRGFGAEVVFAGTTSADRKREAERLQLERHLTMVPPFDHPSIVAGQGTVGLEVVEDCPDFEEIYVPVGGGGLLAGVAVAVKAWRPAARVIGVEPAGAAKMSRSLAAGVPVTLEHTTSIADGLLPVRPGDLTFAHVRALVDEVVTVEDASLADAVGYLAREAHLVVEPSGAAGVAAIRQRYGALDRVEHPIVAVLSGGNIAPERLAEMLRRGTGQG